MLSAASVTTSLSGTLQQSCAAQAVCIPTYTPWREASVMVPPVRSGSERLLSVAAIQTGVSAEEAIGFAQDPLQQPEQAPERSGRA